MSTNYTEQTWADGDATKPLSAARLTHIEDGIAAVDTAAIAAAATAQAAAISASQPVDSDLTAIAALATTAYGRSLLTQANAAAAQSTLGLGSAATQASSAFDAAGAAAAAQAASQPLDSDLTAIAALTTTTFGRSFLALADAAAARTLLGLGTAATQASTAFDTAGAASTAQAASLQKSANLSDLASAATARTNLGLGDVATHAASEFVTTANAAPLAQAGQTPSQVPVLPSTAGSVGSLAVTARADHVHPSAGAYFMYGPGIDGNLTFDGTTTVTVLDPSGSTINLAPSSGVYTLTTAIAAANLTVSAGATLITRQYPLWVSGALTVAGTLHNDGGAGNANGTAGVGLSAASFGASGAGGAGNVGAGSSGGTPTPTDQWSASSNNSSGAGGAGSGGAGGTTSGNSLYAKAGGSIVRRSPMFLRHAVLTSADVGGGYVGVVGGGRGGGGGGGDGTNKGGGGGGGAGTLLVNARILAGAGTIRGNGGAGGTPTTGNCGGGGGGGGGFVLVNVADASAWTGTISANGGAGGSAVGTGVAGTNGPAGFAILTVWP